MTRRFTADDLKRLRDLTGESLRTCQHAADIADDPPFNGDLLWALCAVYASGLAINVKPPEAREQWNIDVGANRAAMLRERSREIAAAYPVQHADTGSTCTP